MGECKPLDGGTPSTAGGYAGATAFLSGHTKRVAALVACPGDPASSLSASVVSGGEAGAYTRPLFGST